MVDRTHRWAHGSRVELTDAGRCAALRYPPCMRWHRRPRWRGPCGPLPGLLLGALFLLAALPGCRITPDEIQRIETENDLLREQIRTMRMECEQYRQLQLEIEDPSEAPRPRDESPDREPLAPR